MNRFVDKSIKKLRNLKPFKNSKNNNNVAVIIIHSESLFAEYSVRSMMDFLGNSWNLHIFTHSKSLLNNMFNGWAYTLTIIDKDASDSKSYNILLKNINFWDCIEGENILLFNGESLIINNKYNIKDIMGYSFIGGGYQYYTNTEIINEYKDHQFAGINLFTFDSNNIQLHNSPNRNFSINGKFSFRKKSSMINALNLVTNDIIATYRDSNQLPSIYFRENNNVNEDIFFQNALEILGDKLPSLEECISFCENLAYKSFSNKSFVINNVGSAYTQRFPKQIKKIFSIPKPIFYVCSYGGCGSKILCEQLNKYGKVCNVHSRNPPDKLSYIGGRNNYHEWFSDKQIPENELTNYKVIYIYRNPIKSILSIFENTNHLKNIQTNTNTTLDDVVNNGEDLYGIKEFYNNYTNKKKRNYKIYCVKYEDFFDKHSELSDILGIGHLDPVKKENKKDISPFNEHVLNIIYKDLIETMNNNPFILEN